jgi:hypothetical protein
MYAFSLCDFAYTPKLDPLPMNLIEPEPETVPGTISTKFPTRFSYWTKWKGQQ